MLKWLSEGSRLLAIAIVFATLATAEAQSNKPIILNIMPDLSLILQRGSGSSDVVVTRDRLIAALEAATNGNHNERIYVRSAKGVRLRDQMAVAIAAGSAGYKIGMLLQSDVTCKSYLALSKRDAETFAGILKFGGTLRHFCEEHPTYTLEDASIELRRGTTVDDASVCKQATGDEAIAACTRLLALNPQDAAAYTSRGVAYANKGEYDQAIADLDQAIGINPKYAAAYISRGGVYVSKGKYDRAIADATEAVRLEPKYAAAYNSRGVAYGKKGDYDRAIADLDQAVRLDPKYAAAYNNRGAVYNSKEEYDRAITDTTEAILLDPKNAAAYRNRGFAYKRKGDHSRASADYDQVMKLNPNSALAWIPAGVDSARTTPDAQRGAVVQGDDASLAALLRRQLYRCWSLPIGLSSAENLVVTVTFSLNRDGSLSGAPQVKPTAGGPQFQVAAESAVRAIRRCTPLKLPADKYELWQEVVVTFDPRMMK